MKKKICLVMTLIVCILMVCCVNAENTLAAGKLSKKQKDTYQKIVNEWVKEAKEQDGTGEQISFSLADINGDGTKELIIYNYVGVSSEDWYSSVYGKNGKCLKAKTYKDSYALTRKSFNKVYGNLETSKYKNGIICCVERFSFGNGETYYQIQKNGVFKEIAHYDCAHIDKDGMQTEFYSVKGKKVSQSVYDKKVKSFGKQEELKLYTATKRNINKIFGQ